MISDIKHRTYLNKKAIRELRSKIPEDWRNILNVKSSVEYIEFKNAVRFIVIEKVPTFIILKDQTSKEIIIPHLRVLVNSSKIQLPRVVIDKGAVPFIMNGANIMRPGVTFFDERIQDGSIVSIYPENFDKPIAVGISTINSDEFNKIDKGAIVKNLHHLNDIFWKLAKKL